MSFWLVTTASLSSLKGEAEGERSPWPWPETRLILLQSQFVLRLEVGSIYRNTDQPLHHFCNIWHFDPLYLLQGCFSLIQYSTDRVNLVRAVSLQCADLVTCPRCECVCTCIQQLVMCKIIYKLNETSIQMAWNIFFFFSFFFVDMF